MGLFGSKSKIRMVDTRTKEQKEISKIFGEFLGPRIGERLPKFGGERIAGLSDLETQGLDAISQLLSSGRSPLFGQAEAALAAPLSGRPSTEVRPEFTEEFFQKSIFDPAFRNLQDVIIPEIESQFAGNFFSSARAGATTEAISDFGSEQAAILAELKFADEQQRRALMESAAGRQLTAAGRVTELGALEESIGLGRIGAAESFGSLPRRLEQARLDFDFSEFIRTLPEFSPAIAQALSFLGTPGLTAVVSPGTEGIGGSLLGAAGTLGAAFI